MALQPPHTPAAPCRWRITRPALLLLLLLAGVGGGLVACTNDAGRFPLPQAQPCVVEWTTSPLGDDILKLRPDKSPDYCSGTQVQQDFEESVVWYREQFGMETCPPASPPAAYPPSLIEELPTYYTGELLHNTRETMYHNQQAERVVIGCWDWEGKRKVSGPEWSEDGRTATLWWSVESYRLLTYDVSSGTPVLVENDDDDEEAAEEGDSATRGNWEAVLIYDEQDGRWKVMQAKNTAF